MQHHRHNLNTLENNPPHRDNQSDHVNRDIGVTDGFFEEAL